MVFFLAENGFIENMIFILMKNCEIVYKSDILF